MCHLTISPLWHVYSFAYDRFNWRDGIRYSNMSFCSNSASISLVDLSAYIVASKKYLRKQFKVELKFICAESQIFFTFKKHDITILVSISHGNRSLTSYIQFHFLLSPNWRLFHWSISRWIRLHRTNVSCQNSSPNLKSSVLNLNIFQHLIDMSSHVISVSILMDIPHWPCGHYVGKTLTLV